MGRVGASTLFPSRSKNRTFVFSAPEKELPYFKALIHMKFVLPRSDNTPLSFNIHPQRNAFTLLWTFSHSRTPLHKS